METLAQAGDPVLIASQSNTDAHLSDQTLLARFVSGDRAALGELAQRYERALLGLASGICGNPELAQDAVQETWARVIRFAQTYKSQSSVKTWLYRITINTSRDARSRARTRSFRLTRDAAKPQSATPTERTDIGLELAQALESLSDNRRLLVLLCYHQGLTHAQAAEVLGVPIGTLKSRLHSVLTELRTLLLREVTKP